VKIHLLVYCLPLTSFYSFSLYIFNFRFLNRCLQFSLVWIAFPWWYWFGVDFMNGLYWVQRLYGRYGFNSPFEDSASSPKWYVHIFFFRTLESFPHFRWLSFKFQNDFLCFFKLNNLVASFLFILKWSHTKMISNKKM
jgi:hypothetical protein